MPVRSDRPPSQVPQLGIVVVSYGSSGLLEENLAVIDRRELPPSMVVVVDNRTTDAERARVEALARQHSWTLVTPGANLGFGGGMNLGVARAVEAGCSWLLLLNPDVEIDAAAVTALLRAASEQPLTLASPRLDRPDGSTWFAGGQLDHRRGLTRSRPDHRQEGPDRWLTGACLLLDSSTWDRVGGFDERYFLYWEDVDLGRRLLDLGGRLLVVHDTIAVHLVGGTQGAGKSATYCRYMCRNRLLYASTHVAPVTRLRWLAHSPRYAALVLLREGRAAALRRPARAVAAAWGSVAGAALVVRSLLADAWRAASRRRG